MFAVNWDPSKCFKYSRVEKAVDWGEQQSPVGQSGGLSYGKCQSQC